jgi:flavorubredoxin
MARKLAQGIADAGVEVKLFDVTTTDRTDLAKEMLDAKGYLIGSSTHDNDMLPTIAGFLELLKGFKPKARVAGLFGSYGWAGGAVAEMGRIARESGIDIVMPPIAFKYCPDENDLKKCYEYGKEFVGKISV